MQGLRVEAEGGGAQEQQQRPQQHQHHTCSVVTISFPPRYHGITYPWLRFARDSKACGRGIRKQEVRSRGRYQRVGRLSM